MQRTSILLRFVILELKSAVVISERATYAGSA